MLTALAIFLLYFNGEAQENAIKPYEGNPSYWQYKGKSVLLLGGSDDENLYQWTGEKLVEQLDLLTGAGGNYLRCTIRDRDEGNLKPWMRVDNGKYDLDRFNAEYWERFSVFLEACHKRDIIVQVEVWATYDYLTNWDISPFRPSNNINLTGRNCSLPEQYDPGIWPGEADKPCPFYHTIPVHNNDTRVLFYQQAYIDKLLSISLAYPNILYCIDNEIWTSAPMEWGWYWSRYIRDKAEEAGRIVNITEMYCFPGFDLRYGEAGMTMILGVLDHPEIFDYLDISNVGMFSGEYFYRQAYEIYYQINRQERPRPVNFVKIYGNPDAGYDLAVASKGPETFWIAITSGMASARFHRPPTGLGINETAQTSIRAMREFEERVRPWECSPRMEMTFDNYQNEAYLITNPGKAYGLYFPKTDLDGKISVDLTDMEGPGTLQWLNVETGKWGAQKTIAGGDWYPLSVPDGVSEYGWAAVILP